MQISRRTWIIAAVVAAVVVVAGGLALAGGSDDASDGVKIGLITGSSGQYAVVGENYIKGVELAKEVWLEEHPDDEVEVIVEDDGYNPQKGLAAFQKLTSVDNVDALVNMSSPTIDSIYSRARELNLPIA